MCLDKKEEGLHFIFVYFSHLPAPLSPPTTTTTTLLGTPLLASLLGGVDKWLQFH
jgi:hypothetical protein